MEDQINNIPFNADIDSRYAPIYNKTIKQLTVVVPGGGCAYYRANKGDVCPFCAFPAFARHVVRGPGHETDFDAWTLDAATYGEMYRRSIDSFETYDKVAIFNGGSFFPQAELPQAFQMEVYDDIAQRSGVTQLMVEAYPQFITQTNLSQAKEALGSKDFMVGIGFESQNDFVRNTLLKKRIARDLFETKVKMMQASGVQVFVYVFLKAPGLTEDQSLQDALHTCAYLHNLGVDEIALSCAFVPPSSQIEKLYDEGKFRPPWLWTILEIQKRAEAFGWPLSIGGFEDFPLPVAGPANCGKCDAEVSSHLDSLRLNGHVSPCKTACDCKASWQLEMMT
jgi:archaeosine synthase beta-subunit